MSHTPQLVLGVTEFFSPKAYLLEEGVMSTLMTFTRATDGKYYDADGIIQTASSGEARINYPQDGSGDFGLFVEDAATNVCLQSEDTTTTWTNVNSTDFANAITAPDASGNGDQIVVDSTVTVPHAIEQTYTGSTTNDFCASVFAKQGTHTDIHLRLSDTADTDYIDIIVDLSDGSILQAATATGGNAAVTDGKVETLVNGWYRIWISGICDSTTTAHKIVIGISQGTTISYTGNGTDSIHVWGAQIEQGSIPTSYIATTTSSATRNIDVPFLDLTSVSWWNATEGSFLIKSKRTAFRTDPGAALTYDDGDNDYDNYTQVTHESSLGSQRYNTTTAASAVVSINNTPTGSNDLFKTAVAYKANDAAMSVNGSLAGTDSANTLFTATRLYIGIRWDGLAINGIVNEVIYYDTRLSNANLNTIST